MHIVFLTSEYPKENIANGGIGTFVKFLAEKLTLKDIKVTVLGINDIHLEEFKDDEGINVYRLKKSNWKFGKFIDQTKRIQSKLKEINKNCKIDIVEGSELNFAFFPKKTTYKKIIRLHGGHHFFAFELDKKPALWRGFQEKISFKKADEFIAVSNYVGTKTKQYLNYKFKYTVIYNSINLDGFYKSSFSKEIKGKLVFIGTVCEKKGVEQLIKAFALIRKKLPNVTLDIIGRDWSSSEISSYIGYLKENYSEIINKGISFKGTVPYQKIPGIIENAQICVYPSLAESFGLTIIEAMAMGKPVAASNIAPFKEITKDTSTVSFFNPFSIESISNSILNLLENDKVREQHGINNRQYILDKFDISKIVNKNIAFYESMICK